MRTGGGQRWPYGVLFIFFRQCHGNFGILRFCHPAAYVGLLTQSEALNHVKKCGLGTVCYCSTKGFLALGTLNPLLSSNYPPLKTLVSPNDPAQICSDFCSEFDFFGLEHGREVQ